MTADAGDEDADDDEAESKQRKAKDGMVTCENAAPGRGLSCVVRDATSGALVVRDLVWGLIPSWTKVCRGMNE